MIPENTNHTTLSIYFDFLEDKNENTEELRESLIQPELSFWDHEYIHNPKIVGINLNFNVGSNTSAVGSRSNYHAGNIGAYYVSCVGTDFYTVNNSVGGSNN